MSAILSTTTESLNFAETPVAAIALIAGYMQIPVEEVAGMLFLCVYLLSINALFSRVRCWS